MATAGPDESAMTEPPQPGPRYAFEEPIAFADPTEIARGVYWLRMPLPFALDHINLWLIDAGPSWLLIDTGLNTGTTRRHWETLLRGPIGDKPIGRILCTHFHPDHAGLAGWLGERTRADLMMTRQEWLMGRLLTSDASAATEAHNTEFYRRTGLDVSDGGENPVSVRSFAAVTSPFPRDFVRIVDGGAIEAGTANWRVMVGKGHAPEHACLYSTRHNVLISGDQVLPKITTNISVSPFEPDGNPLAEFLGSLDLFASLPDDVLVLPSHGIPFRGLHDRIGSLRRHHDERLQALATDLKPGMCVAEAATILFPHVDDPVDLRFAAGETAAHLNHLAAGGALGRRTAVDGVWRFEPLR
jgi:glyoxylase-like metal-dependent hydrolase (beta-lactamase superfamily II)